MAWTQTDLDAIEAAMVTPEMRVRFQDGREVQYRSMSELLSARDVIKAAITAVSGAGVRSNLATFRKD